MPVTFGHYYTAKMNLFNPKNAALSPKMSLFFLYLSKNPLLAQVRPASRLDTPVFCLFPSGT